MRSVAVETLDAIEAESGLFDTGDPFGVERGTELSDRGEVPLGRHASETSRLARRDGRRGL